MAGRESQRKKGGPERRRSSWCGTAEDLCKAGAALAFSRRNGGRWKETVSRGRNIPRGVGNSRAGLKGKTGDSYAKTMSGENASLL